MAAYEQLLRAATILKEENEPYSEPMRPTVQIFLDTATADINRLGVTESRSILHCCAETVTSAPPEQDAFWSEINLIAHKLVGRIAHPEA